MCQRQASRIGRQTSIKTNEADCRTSGLSRDVFESRQRLVCHQKSRKQYRTTRSMLTLHIPRGSHESSSDPDLIYTSSRGSQPVPLTRLINPHQSFTIASTQTPANQACDLLFLTRSLGLSAFKGSFVQEPRLSLPQLSMARYFPNRELARRSTTDVTLL